MLLDDLVLNLAQKKKINKEVIEAAKRVYLKGSSGSETLRSSDILHTYRNLINTNRLKPNNELEKALQLKNIRSSSGVAVVTVLTKPWLCPGSCIFCPNEEGMPKSYLSSEPAAMRAKQKDFDPFSQVTIRLQQYRNIGHPIDKIELIILGGSFTAYPFHTRNGLLKNVLEHAMNLRIRVNQSVMFFPTTKPLKIGLSF